MKEEEEKEEELYLVHFTILIVHDSNKVPGLHDSEVCIFIIA